MGNCTRCGHPYRLHVVGDELRCRMRIAYQWNEKRKTFMKTAPCRCPGYRGTRPVNPARECPHEYVVSSDKCVACGHVRTAWERMR